jgi:DNA-binding PadR family transcriptional regulator
MRHALAWEAPAGRPHHHHRHGRHGRHGDHPARWLAMAARDFGFGPRGIFGPPGRGGPRMRRGDVRAAALLLLEEGPTNGYGIMQELERRTGGAWRPSPGSVYPALQQLEDEGLVRAEETDGRKLFHLTDEGRAAAEASAGEGAPWEAASDSVDSDVWELFGVARQVGMAVFQIAQAGTADQLTAAREVLNNARRALYGILAEDETTDPPQEA